MWSPEADGRSLIRLFADSVPVAAILAELEPNRLQHQVRFADKSPSYASLQSYHPTSVHRRGIGLEAVVFISKTSVFTGERVNTDIYQELLRQHVVPGSRGT
jgi:hypothetical protein